MKERSAYTDTKGGRKNKRQKNDDTRGKKNKENERKTRLTERTR